MHFRRAKYLFEPAIKIIAILMIKQRCPTKLCEEQFKMALIFFPSST